MRTVLPVGVMLAASAVLALASSSGAAGSSTAASSAIHGAVAGYGVQNLGPPEIKVRNATASWIQPRAIVRGYHDAYSAAYLGFNDMFNDGLESYDPQIGTEANTIGGKAQYFAWYTPGQHVEACYGDGYCPPVRIGAASVLPGDHMTTSMSYKGTRFTLRISDVRYRKHHAPERWTRTIRLYDSDAYPAGMSVGISWVLYAGNEILPLAHFAPTHFTNVDVNGSVIGSYVPANGSQYDLEGVETAIATSSGLNRTGDGFTVTWHGSS